MDGINVSKEEIISNLKSAQERLESAEILLKAGKYNDSISRSYYAFLDVARAALLTKKIATKSHEGTVQQFGLHLVKTGLIPTEYGKSFSKALGIRMDADYERMMSFSQEEASELLVEAKSFVETVSAFVSKEISKEGL